MGRKQTDAERNLLREIRDDIDKEIVASDAGRSRQSPVVTGLKIARGLVDERITCTEMLMIEDAGSSAHMAAVVCEVTGDHEEHRRTFKVGDGDKYADSVITWTTRQAGTEQVQDETDAEADA